MPASLKFPVPQMSSKLVSLLIHFHVTENSQELFGFYDEKERNMFRMLIGISGIGPKTAIAMLSNITPQEFKSRIIRRVFTI